MKEKGNERRVPSERVDRGAAAGADRADAGAASGGPGEDQAGKGSREGLDDLQLLAMAQAAAQHRAIVAQQERQAQNGVMVTSLAVLMSSSWWGAFPELQPMPKLKKGFRDQEFIGVRYWMIRPPTSILGKTRLSSPMYHLIWLPRKPVTARGFDTRIYGGIYAYKPENAEQFWAEFREHPVRGFEDGDRVVGTVRLWGRVIECERGYRAEHAMIRTLDYLVTSRGRMYDNNPKLRRLREIYGL